MAALEYVATELTDATKAVQTAVADARAADAKIRTGSHARGSVLKRGTAVLGRLSKHLACPGRSTPTGNGLQNCPTRSCL